MICVRSTPAGRNYHVQQRSTPELSSTIYSALEENVFLRMRRMIIVRMRKD